MTTIRRLYVDSRLRSSGTGSDFTVELPRSFEIPDQTIAFVDSVLVPNVFPTIHENNNRLYSAEREAITLNVTEHIYTLNEGNYTGSQLAQHVQDKINSNSSLNQPYSVSYEEKTGKITISNNGGNIAIPTRNELIELRQGSFPWANQTLETDLRDCHDVIGFNTTNNESSAGVLVTEGFVDLMPYKNLFLCSSSIGNMGTVVGPNLQDDIIRRIAVTSGFGNVIYDAHSTSADYIDCSLTQLSQMRFRLTDEFGRTVALKGHGISFSICFMEKSVV